MRKPTTPVDQQLSAATMELLRRLEATLEPGMGAMIWLYTRNTEELDLTRVMLGPQVDVGAFHSKESPDETLRLIRTVATTLLRQHSENERRYDRPDSETTSPTPVLISSAVVTTIGAHDRVLLWNRGAMAGELLVSKGDGAALAAAFGLAERP